MKKILVVDDEAATRTLFSEVLVEAGYEVHSAENGLVALQALAEQKMDLVLTDIRMPEVNGKTLITCMRTQYPDLPAIIVSGYVQDMGTIGTNIKACLTKPVDLENLMNVIQGVLTGTPQ